MGVKYEQLELPLEFPVGNEVATVDAEEDEDDEDVEPDSIGPVYLRAGACPPCYSGVHGDCLTLHLDDDGDKNCCCPETTVSNEESGSRSSNQKNELSVVDRIKEASEITDVQSTGRKRAALAYPITEGMICEWSRLALAGGGVKPIVGCNRNKATDIHHGPDKNTLNNTPENVHRICSHCHNRWHAANDEFYGKRPSGTEPFIPLEGHNWTNHNGESQATDEQIVANEIYWATPKAKRTKYESLKEN